jgi:DNA topoisomerase-1
MSDSEESGAQSRKRKRPTPAPRSAGKRKSTKDESSEDESSGDSDGGSGSGSGSDSDSDSSAAASSGDERVSSKKARKPAAKKTAVAAKKSSSSSSAKAKSSSSSSAKKEKKPVKLEDRIAKVKSRSKMERLEEARKAFKWWEVEDLEDGLNWRQLEHTGICFPEDYVPHSVPLTYDGKEVTLSPAQEEVASFYAAIPDDGPQLGNPKTRVVFQKNFMHDFKEVLGPGHVVKKFSLCDFGRIRMHLERDKELKKAASADEKLVRKKEREAIALQYGFCLIDGRIEKMGNFNMEPPGLFRGRGEHPRTGAMKKRTFPEAVSLNISEHSAVPVCLLPGHAWKRVQHDPTVTWLCNWSENVQNQSKYVMLAASSSFKGKSDMEKYDKAIELKGCIGKIRADYTSKIKSTDRLKRELGTAMWVIDILALRVGGEKNEEEADTVGCCSLRSEHFKFSAVAGSYELELEFLGKDSMLFKQNINFAEERFGDLGKLVYTRLKSFCAGKPLSGQVFDEINPSVLNKHLSSLMRGLSAKVFRTYNASITLEDELPSPEEIEDLSVQEKLQRYNDANRQVAILCNHQKTVSKAAETMFENLRGRLDVLVEQRQEMEKWKLLARKGNEKKIPLKTDNEDETSRIAEELKNSIAAKDSAKSGDDKLAAAKQFEASKLKQKEDLLRRTAEKHKFKTVPTETAIVSRIQKWTEDIRKMELDIRIRDENKEVALGTSKINYMDPRISIAWCKRCEVPIEKVFAKTLRDKFNWAMIAGPDWKFE